MMSWALPPGSAPLPEYPPFPVYGLADSYAGARWLGGWDGLLDADLSRSGNRLWYVQLGHGDYEHRAPVLVVTTDAKLPAIEVRSGTWVGPTGLIDVARNAQLGMISIALPSDNDERLSLMRVEVSKAHDLAKQIGGPDWASTTATVDNARLNFRLRHLGDAWAAVADLGEVALGVYGRGINLTDHCLEAATDLPILSA